MKNKLTMVLTAPNTICVTISRHDLATLFASLTHTADDPSALSEQTLREVIGESREYLRLLADDIRTAWDNAERAYDEGDKKGGA